ncbi:hypothetical protein [Solirubrum puertoriconensis]|uniref:Uncharacterized protein n=1 Tax=Solirubrum puertoriconensis TaxID=1751427 RepID=A0A9X0L3E4_SOLP1|nr:hypothetical protein [Solirubrum puertoriconensis]KUG06440.1 hypothetical protein ASU33_03530 [Solirubrum puertoriconensis]
MLILAWSVLNVVLAMLVLVATFKVFNLLRNKIGLAWTSVLVLGLLLSGCGANSDMTSAKRNLIERDTKARGNALTLTRQELGPSSKLEFLLEYNKAGDSWQPNGLYATASGFLFGHAWEPMAGMATQQGQRCQYFVAMLHKWKLLGMPIYSTSEDYTGYFSLK